MCLYAFTDGVSMIPCQILGKRFLGCGSVFASHQIPLGSYILSDEHPLRVRVVEILQVLHGSCTCSDFCVGGAHLASDTYKPQEYVHPEERHSMHLYIEPLVVLCIEVLVYGRSGALRSYKSCFCLLSF